jgi:hypothetical protein
MADEESATTVEDEKATAAPDNSPNPQTVGNTVAFLLSALALVATAVVLLWMWNIGDMWPTGAGNAIPPCLPDLDHHCIP